MDTIAERAVIQYLHRKGLAPEAILADIITTLEKDASLDATVEKWCQNLSVAWRALRIPGPKDLPLWQLLN